MSESIRNVQSAFCLAYITITLHDFEQEIRDYTFDIISNYLSSSFFFVFGKQPCIYRHSLFQVLWNLLLNDVMQNLSRLW